MSISKDIAAWYWKHGSRRKTGYELSTAGWLDQLYRVSKTESRIQSAEFVERPSMAVWGPSQAGKSTLISSYIDAGSDETGEGSGLHWDAEIPARFTRADNVESLHLNPHNFGSDATCCVTRFRLAEQVKYPNHPVELFFASPIDLAHALACGYLSECWVKDQQGQQLPLTIDSLEVAIDTASETKAEEGSPRQECYVLLHDLADLLELLSNSSIDRYRNLRTKQQELRRKLLAAASRLDSLGRVENLMAALLWDGHETITQLYRELASRANEEILLEVVLLSC